jgi:hypothetical protein
MGSFFIFTDDKKYFQLYFDDIRGPNFEFYRLFVRYDAFYLYFLTNISYFYLYFFFTKHLLFFT